MIYRKWYDNNKRSLLTALHRGSPSWVIHFISTKQQHESELKPRYSRISDYSILPTSHLYLKFCSCFKHNSNLHEVFKLGWSMCFSLISYWKMIRESFFYKLCYRDLEAFFFYHWHFKYRNKITLKCYHSILIANFETYS